MQRWVSYWLYYNLPGWVFAAAYAAFLLVVAVTWFRIPSFRMRTPLTPDQAAAAAQSLKHQVDVPRGLIEKLFLPARSHPRPS